MFLFVCPNLLVLINFPTKTLSVPNNWWLRIAPGATKSPLWRRIRIFLQPGLLLRLSALHFYWSLRNGQRAGHIILFDGQGFIIPLWISTGNWMSKRTTETETPGNKHSPSLVSEFEVTLVSAVLWSSQLRGIWDGNQLMLACQG